MPNCRDWIGAHCNRHAPCADRYFYLGTVHRVCLLLFMGSSLFADEIRFNEHVRPILAEHCLHCHGPDESHREGELRLDTEDAAKASVIVTGDPDKSTFMHRITSQDPDERMPPVESGKTLSSQQIELLRQWIKAWCALSGTLGL